MTIDQAIERFQRLVDSGWKCPTKVQLITDGLNMDSVGGRDAPPDVVDKHFRMIAMWMKITGQVTLRAQWFHPDQPSWVKVPLNRVLVNAKAHGARVDIALKIFGQKYTPGGWKPSDGGWAFITPGHTWDVRHRELCGYWFECLAAAANAGVKLRYALIDHPPNMDKWRAGQSKELDAVITQRWELQLAQLKYVFRTKTENGTMLMTSPPKQGYDETEPDIIVYGQSLGEVLPKGLSTGWLSHNGYAINNNDREHKQFAELVHRQRTEKLMLYFKAEGRNDNNDWGRVFAGKAVGQEFADRIDAIAVWPTIFRNEASITGVVELIEGIAGVRG